MHGTRDDKQLPMFGNKGIGIMNGIFDMHGKVRDHTFTLLNTTADVGATSVELMVAVDWVVGEEVVIASTDYEMEHAEVRIISAVSNDKLTLSFTEPLKYKHYSAVETYGT